jgi:hypothetical protein
VGSIKEGVWVRGNLSTTFTNAITAAGNDYAAQFPIGRTTMGVLGSGHNSVSGAQRIVALNATVNAAATDTARVTAVQNFLNGPHSYKDGSLKLLVVRRLNFAIRGVAMATITPANAQATGQTLLNGILQGQW